MARTTAELVAGIIEVDEDIDVIPFIDAANMLVTELCTSSSYDASRLEMIERWLSAHFYTCRDPQRVMERADMVFEQYQTKTGLGLATSHFGQQAMMLDTKGGLAAWNNAMQKVVPGGNRGSFSWLGKTVRDVGEA